MIMYVIVHSWCIMFSCREPFKVNRIFDKHFESLHFSLVIFISREWRLWAVWPLWFVQLGDEISRHFKIITRYKKNNYCGLLIGPKNSRYDPLWFWRCFLQKKNEKLTKKIFVNHLFRYLYKQIELVTREPANSIFTRGPLNNTYSLRPAIRFHLFSTDSPCKLLLR